MHNHKFSAQELTLREDLRQAWTDHGIWLHENIASEFSPVGNAKYVSRKLLTIPTDLSSIFIQYYGKDPGAKLKKLLQDYTQIGLEYLVAVSSSDAKKRTDALKRWRKNADDLGTFSY